MPFNLRTLAAGPLAAAMALMAACGDTASEPFSLMSPQQEKQIGAEEHPKIIQQFGGVYDDPKVTGYVAEIGGRMAANSDNPDVGYTFTVLNDPLVNAFALPGGYVYVTRGLMALANNEAEFASVVGHEIGHVTARHAAQRYTRGTVLGLGSTLLGAVLGSAELGQLAQLGSELYLSSYSRDQEFDADLIGVRVLKQAGYAPQAAASFLSSLNAYSELERQISGQTGAAPGADFFATHPRTPDRVERAIDAAGEAGPVPSAPLRRDAYLSAIDGMIYGDDPKQGVIRGRTFSHPDLRFAFTVPDGFRLMNSETAVLAVGPDGARIRFDAEQAAQARQMDPTSYLTRLWGSKLPLRDVEAITVNGMPGATGQASVTTNSGPGVLRLVAVRFPRGMYRLLFLAPPAVAERLDEDFRRTAYSLKQLSEAEAAAIKPLRIRLITVRAGDTTETLAGRMAMPDHQLEHFLVLNGLQQGEPVPVGQTVKIVSE